jgi:ribonuclease HII
LGALQDRLVAFDRERSDGGRLTVAGVDEAGRGCWAGPVVAAAVILAPQRIPAGLNDSKRLTPRQREDLFVRLRREAVCWRATAVSAPEIDRLNILQATLAAMARAVARLDPCPDLILVDGNRAPAVRPAVATVVKGDARSAAVAAASIVAKVLRDRVMIAWARHYPVYGFAGHKGYGAPAHRRALTACGPCPLHRLSFQPVALLDQTELWSGRD